MGLREWLFGTRESIWAKQLKRALVVENHIKAGVFDRQVKLHGYNASDNKPSNDELAISGGAVNHILALDIEKQVKMLGGESGAAGKIQSLASRILADDYALERLVIRVLYEIASLCQMLERDEWAMRCIQDHPRIMDVLVVARDKHPDLFRDTEEATFKVLFDRFIDDYLPDMKQTSKALFD